MKVIECDAQRLHIKALNTSDSLFRIGIYERKKSLHPIILLEKMERGERVECESMYKMNGSNDTKCEQNILHSKVL